MRKTMLYHSRRIIGGMCLILFLAACSAPSNIMQWTDCRGDVSVIHYRIEGGKHVWPKTLGHLATHEAIWHFLLAYTLPQ